MYPAEPHSGLSAAKVEITAFTDGDAKWYFDDIPVTPGKFYTYSDWYTSDVASSVTVRYYLGVDGKAVEQYDYAYLGAAPASPAAWMQVTGTFTPPVGARSFTVSHAIKSIGFLTIDDVSVSESAGSGGFTQGFVTLAFDDGWNSQYVYAVPKLDSVGIKGSFYIITDEMINASEQYMNTSYVLDLYHGGHEIGSHTRTHCSLTGNTGIDIGIMPCVDPNDEIIGSRDALLSIGISPVTTFSYPFGDHNASIEALVRNAGFIGARRAWPGFNGKSSNKFALLFKEVDITTTVPEVKSWIDYAIQNKTWLILTFHKIDTVGGDFRTTPQSFNDIVDYLIARNAKVVTMNEGIEIMNEPDPSCSPTATATP